MTIDEAIKHCEEVAHQYEILMKRYDDASGYNRSHNESIRTNGAKGCEQLISLYRQLAEWLRELKTYREAVKEIKAYASIWMEWDEGMSKHEIAEKAMTDAKEGFIAIVEKHLKEVSADDSDGTN